MSDVQSELARWRIAYDTISALATTVDAIYSYSPGGDTIIHSNSADGATVGGQQQQHCRCTLHNDVSSVGLNHHVTHVIHPSESRSLVTAPAWMPGNVLLMSSLPAAFQGTGTINSHFTSSVAIQTDESQLEEVEDGSTIPTLFPSRSSMVPSDRRSDQQMTFATNSPTRNYQTFYLPSPLPILTNAEVLLSLFQRLMDSFYSEVFLWIYLNTLIHPGARRTRNRLRWLAASTQRPLEQAAANVLTGYLAGYRQSRRALTDEVEVVLRDVAALGGRVGGSNGATTADRLSTLSIELGVVLSPNLMMKSFSAVVRDLVHRTTRVPSTGNTVDHSDSATGHIQRSNSFHAERLHRNHCCGSRHHHYHHHHQQPQQQQQQQQSTESSQTFQPAQPALHTTSLHGQTSFSNHHPQETIDPASESFQNIPPPPPPYPGFLLHFLSVLTIPPSSWDSIRSFASDTDVTDGSFSYETLLELGELLGDAKPRGLTADDVNQLPLYVADSEGPTPPSGSHSRTSCVICLELVDRGQLVRSLPCCHEYHAKCIDRWLAINRTCPICRYEINVNSFKPMSSV